jgi:hypothetical protein
MRIGIIKSKICKQSFYGCFLYVYNLPLLVWYANLPIIFSNENNLFFIFLVAWLFVFSNKFKTRNSKGRS